MKRSEVNAIMREADQFIRKNGFHLPPYAYFGVGDWLRMGPEAIEIARNGLGWDITDFGSNNFEHIGLFLFTLRNGHKTDWEKRAGKLYCEKIMVVEIGQLTPMHFHWLKVEDIINRGGGNLLIQLYNSSPDGDLDRDTDVVVTLDGIQRKVQAGTVITLTPGESITLTNGLYHQFWGERERTLVGEVSLVNDDANDNRFYDRVGRFPEIEEDEEPLHLLVSDYPKYYAHA